MKLTHQMIKAGISKIANLKNTSGSWTCEVDLSLVDKASNGVNFRKFSKKHMKEIMADFNYRAVRNPVLIYSNGVLRSIDGRHTIAVILEMHKEKLKEVSSNRWTCDVFFDINIYQSAAIFHELTTKSMRMSCWDSFAAALQAKYDFAIDMLNILNNYKMKTPKHDGYSNKTADFTAYTTLSEAYYLGGDFFNTFLKVISIWKGKSKLQPTAGSCPFQRGLIDYLKDELNVATVENIYSRLKKFQATDFSDIANKHAWGYGKSRADRNHYKRAFKELTNSKLLNQETKSKKK